MKMSKQLKEVLLKGFEENLVTMRASERLAQEYKAAGNEKDKNFWTRQRENCQEAILKAIGDLIEEEGEIENDK